VERHKRGVCRGSHTGVQPTSQGGACARDGEERAAAGSIFNVRSEIYEIYEDVPYIFPYNPQLL
jgi:hypothetical protein